MAPADQVDRGRWTQLTNSWPRIARTLGLKRKARPARRLADVTRGIR